MSGLYIHIPFCRRKCDYCDFFSVVADEDERRQVVGLIGNEISRWRGKTVNTLYLGGGDPGILHQDELALIMTAIKNNLQIADRAECTIELRPEAITAAQLQHLRELGFNRISVGIQSFNESERRELGRECSEKTITSALELLASTWENCSLDLIYGIPHQTERDWQNSLQRAVSYKPSHISLYNLTVTEGTPLAHRVNVNGKEGFPAEEAEIAMLKQAMKFLRDAGFEHYEVSNWSRPGYRSQHNLGYWSGDDYIGCGPGAVTTWGGQRYQRITDISAYLASGARAESWHEEHTPELTLRERVMLGLRLRTGLDDEELQGRWQWSLRETYAPELAAWQEQGDLTVVGSRIRITDAGIPRTDTIIADLLP